MSEMRYRDALGAALREELSQLEADEFIARWSAVEV